MKKVVSSPKRDGQPWGQGDVEKESVFQRLEELPYRRYVDVLRNKINDLNKTLDHPAYFDQYPGKTVPWIFSKLYGPIGMQTARRFGAAGFEFLAPVVTPARFIIPRTSNIKTGRDASFYWCSTNIAGFCSWTYVSDPGFPSPIDPKNPADIFDPAIENNGGASALMNFMGTYSTEPERRPRIAFEIDLYDKKRGRSLTDGRIPSEAFSGGAFKSKPVFGSVRFDPDTEIEPRVYITEIRMSHALDTTVAFNAARVACYLNITFQGYNVLEERNSP